MAGETDFNLTIARQGTFFVSGAYCDRASGDHVMTGQMYVEYQIPANLAHATPIVMMHGAGQTGNNFRSTPDGRPGWADLFLSWGYGVYVVDQVGRGRSGLAPELSGKTMSFAAETVQNRFTAGASRGLWPQAELHTQWPGVSGQMGDPVFDQYFASTVPGIADHRLAEDLNAVALAALFDRIGPGIMMVHSQSGGSGWRIGDARPDLVKAIVSVEPMGPPFSEMEWVGPPNYGRHRNDITYPYGICRGKLTFDPPVADPAELVGPWQSAPDGPGCVVGRLQAEPARKLVNLAGIPVLILSGEGSYHAGYDHLTSQFLTQAGVANTHIRLEQRGIRGNGHMMMLEKNNREVARLIADWLEQSLR